jgi:hypothetical protein
MHSSFDRGNGIGMAAESSALLASEPDRNRMTKK